MEETWGVLSEAVEFYEMAEVTLRNWRKSNKVTTRVVMKGKRVSYEYLLDDNLKKEIKIMKSLDNRWK